jgi:hypothetical protein
MVWPSCSSRGCWAPPCWPCSAMSWLHWAICRSRQRPGAMAR